MNRFNSVFSVTGLVLAIGASMAAGDAMAVTQTRVFAANATELCQTSLPVFDGQVRKRPLAVQNEGTSNAFVTCSFTSQATPTKIRVYAQNTGTAEQSLSCTMVTGAATGINQFVTKTVILPTTGFQDVMTWLPADFAGAMFPTNGLYSVSCNLEPGVGLNDTYVNFVEDVGA